MRRRCTPAKRTTKQLHTIIAPVLYLFRTIAPRQLWVLDLPFCGGMTIYGAQALYLGGLCMPRALWRMVTTYSSSDAEQSISISTILMMRISPITGRACM